MNQSTFPGSSHFSSAAATLLVFNSSPNSLIFFTLNIKNMYTPNFTSSPLLLFTSFTKNPSFLRQLNPKIQISTKLPLLSLNFAPPICSKLCNCEPKLRTPICSSSNNVTHKLNCLISEFKSLTEPIERVKRLLHYATLLPFLDESIRFDENRVAGCTAQVWLEVKLDFEGFMRFRIDSDSEITKGFASCLIWLLDGATPEEVVAVNAEDLVDMNLGILPANSRVNTWNTVLISMQKRTLALVEQRCADSSKSFSMLSCCNK